MRSRQCTTKTGFRISLRMQVSSFSHTALSTFARVTRDVVSSARGRVATRAQSHRHRRGDLSTSLPKPNWEVTVENLPAS